jgi:hypothetical protein
MENFTFNEGDKNTRNNLVRRLGKLKDKKALLGINAPVDIELG